MPTPLHKNQLTEDRLKRFWEQVDQKYFDPDQGIWKKSYGNCTYLNSSAQTFLRAAGHTVKIVGFGEEVKCGLQTKWGLLGGHDWITIDDHLLLDIWAVAYLLTPKALWDLNNTKDRRFVRENYPPPATWEELPPYKNNPSTTKDWEQFLAHEKLHR